MRKADRETESRKLIGGKLREARMADNSPMTEADAEYYRILAEARATHASKENTRKSAKKHAFTSAAAILLILAVAGGSFILGMQSDVRASADPDDERKVVQQGDNVVIGSGVSEDDENVGVVTKTYYSLEDVPEDIRIKIITLESFDLDIEKIKVNVSKSGIGIDTKYYSNNNNLVEISERRYSEKTEIKEINLEGSKEIIYEGIIICQDACNDGQLYMRDCEKKSVNYLPW